MLKHKKRINSIFVIVVTILSVILALLPTGFENPSMTASTLRETALVTHVNNNDLQKMGLVTVGTQDVTIEVLSGRFKGDTLTAHNVMMGQMTFDKIFKEGDKVLSVLKLNEDRSKVIGANARDIYRINYELILFVLFALFLVSFAGWTGIKALLSFIFTALAMWKVLIPCFLKGVAPLPLSFAVVSATTTVIILLISGFTRKGVVALSGSVAGIGITTILALVFGHFFRVPGTVLDFSEMLLYTGYGHLNLSDIFTAGIFISAAGAVMDVAMDIAAAQNEIKEKRPDINRKELIQSGFRVAYPVIGTMTTTLLFAYSGNFMFTFMVFMAKGTPMVNIFNINYIAAEVLHTMVGSFGLVLVAPATAIIGGYVYSFRQKIENGSEASELRA